MPPKRFSPKSPLSLLLESISQNNLRPLTRFFTPRSTSTNKTSSLSPGLIGGIVVIGFLILLCAAGAGLAFHVHYCRQSDCPMCCAVLRFKWWSHSVQGWHLPWVVLNLPLTYHHESLTVRDRNSSHPQTQQHESSQTPRNRVYLLAPNTQDGLMPFPTLFPPLTLPPTAHIRGPQNPEIIMSDSVVSIRGSITPSVISDDYAPTLRASETIHPCPSSRNSPTSFGGMVTSSGRTVDGSSDLSADLSTITLPSFVEQVPPSQVPSPMLPTPARPAMSEYPSSSSSRFSFQTSRSRSMVANIAASPSKIILRHDLPSPSTYAPDRLLHRPRSSSPRWADVRRELSTARLKSGTQLENVRTVQPGTLETSEQPRTTSFRRDSLSPSMIPAHTLSFPGDYKYTPCCGRCPLSEERHTGPVSSDYPLPISPKSPPRDGIPPALYMGDLTESSPSCQSAVLGFLNSPSSHTSLDGKRSRGTSQATSSMSTVPSISAFPSPPDFTPSPRYRTLSIFNNDSISGQPVLPAMPLEKAPVGGAETASSNKGRASTPLPAADAPRLMAGVSSRISTMKRLSRVPLGPRQMCGGPKSPLGWTSQPPFI